MSIFDAQNTDETSAFEQTAGVAYDIESGGTDTPPITPGYGAGGGDGGSFA